MSSTTGVRSCQKPIDETAAQRAQQWLARLVTMINVRDSSTVQELFAPGAGWRDLLAVTWDTQTAVGHDALRGFVASTITSEEIVSCRLTDDVAPALTDVGSVAVVETSFEFETANTRCRGLARLVPVEESEWAAITVFTELQALAKSPDPTTRWDAIADPRWNQASMGNQNWTESRSSARAFPTDAPTVLLVGAGQAALQVAAHLGRLGIDCMLVERNEHLGDSWRKRHDNLITHTPSFSDHFPYLPFPESWPISMQKDKLANWIEAYADALDLDVWTGHECTGARWVEDEGRWEVQVRRPSGDLVALRPKHLIVATGLLGAPKEPRLPHRGDFAGAVMHSTQYRSGRDWAGRKVVVVGSGSTAHDICQDLVEQGCPTPTMIQRSSTYVMSYRHGVRTAYGKNYGPHDEVDLDVADLRYKSTPLPILVEQSDAVTEHVAADCDAELIERLEARGFRTNQAGMLRLSLTPYLAGYYINQGASDLIIEGRVEVRAGEVADLDRDGVVFSDGSRVDADVVVLCTGYHNASEALRRLIGDDVADRCGTAWVLDYERRGGEHGLLWGESGYSNLWFAAGGLHQSRLYSPCLALKIAALEAGVVTAVGRPA